MFHSIMDRNISEGRLFLAALPDVATAVRMHRLATMLKRAHRFSGKLIARDRLHASLFFLGGLPEQMVFRACQTLSDIRVPPFEA
jgi:RNA 2',3'-cyclic 3'-phosphodiesterase